jgi:thiosulfate/3-mercaptopyruvate sulfurtransferase
MKSKKTILSFIFLLSLTIFSFTFLNDGGPYSPENLIAPADLAKMISHPSGKAPVILNVGSMKLIKNAESGGMGYSDEGMKEFKSKVSKLDKNQLIVIYCGCCKMENCPNVKSPFDYLQSAGFKNFKILNIETGLYEDWISKGYPMN